MSFVILFRREFLAYFKSSMAYVVMFFFFAVTGLVFYINAKSLSHPQAAPTEYPLHFWFIYTLLFALTLIIPAITMRLMAEEMKSGTIESLATAPVRDAEIVVSKYLAALAFYCVLLLPTVFYALILRENARPVRPDLGPILSGYLGLLCIGGFFLAIGTLTSTLARDQMVAYISAAMAIMLLQMTFFLRNFLVESEIWKKILRPFDFFDNFQNFGRGVVDTRHIVFYVASAVFLLFVSVHVLKWRKWRV
jgi:ABC-2 type transport system permease protein